MIGQHVGDGLNPSAYYKNCCFLSWCLFRMTGTEHDNIAWRSRYSDLVTDAENLPIQWWFLLYIAAGWGHCDFWLFILTINKHWFHLVVGFFPAPFISSLIIIVPMANSFQFVTENSVIVITSSSLWALPYDPARRNCNSSDADSYWSLRLTKNYC